MNFVKIIGNRKGVMKMELKEKLITSVEKNLDTYMSYVQHMYDHPEIGNEEFETMELLSEGLLSFGFETQKAFVVPTGFQAVYKTGIGRNDIGSFTTITNNTVNICIWQCILA